MDSRGEGTTTATAKALAMLSAFASVDARAFNLTLTDIDGNKMPGGYKPNRGLEEMRRTIGRILQSAERTRHNVIIRPRSSTATLIQLDDLDLAKAERIAPLAFIVFKTSPGNGQAWVAVEKGAPEDFGRRLRKGIGADLTASGSTRIAGSRNFKSKYSPIFPTVEITHARAGNIASMAALEQAGFVAPRPREEPRPAREPDHSPRRWPSYALCIQGAPPAQGDPERIDVSRADFTWCRTAYQWGHSIEAIEAQLAELSSAAKKDGPRYVQLTVTRAAASVDRERQAVKSTARPG
jgi:RepB DNA-primase from phage plasmid